MYLPTSPENFSQINAMGNKLLEYDNKAVHACIVTACRTLAGSQTMSLSMVPGGKSTPNQQDSFRSRPTMFSQTNTVKALSVFSLTLFGFLELY